MRPDRLGDLLIRTAMFSGVSAMAVFAVLQPIGLLDIPVPHSARYYLPFMSAVGALSGGAPVVIRAFARGSMSYLRLTRKARVRRGGAPPGTWPMGQCARHYRSRTESSCAQGPFDRHGDARRGDATIAVGAYSPPDGSAVRRMVQFYWKHPDHRDELMDGRAVQRLRDDDFGQARRKLG